MKYVPIICLILLIGCRSSKHNMLNLSEDAVSEQTDTVVRNDSVLTQTADSIATTVTTSTQEFVRTTNYRDDGTISSVQEQWRRTGSSQLAVGTRRTSEVHISREEQNTAFRFNKKLELNELKSIKSDSRLIQGSEWLYLFVVCFALIGLIILIYKKKKNEHPVKP